MHNFDQAHNATVLNWSMDLQEQQPVHNTAQLPNMAHLPKMTHLPKIQVPTYSGNITEWKPFWEAYNVALGSQNIPDVINMTFLMGALQTAVDGYTVTAANYPIVISTLKRRFGDESTV